MAKVNWTDEAEGLLRDIHDYIAADNPEAASRTIEGIHARADLLERFPLVGHWYVTALGREVRILLYGHYRIAYIVRSEETVQILGVFHGALDIDRYLL